jgi:hypothetical protein
MDRSNVNRVPALGAQGAGEAKGPAEGGSQSGSPLTPAPLSRESTSGYEVGGGKRKRENEPEGGGDVVGPAQGDEDLEDGESLRAQTCVIPVRSTDMG